MKNSQYRNLGETARLFLASLPPGEGKASQQEIYHFVRWYGAECPLAALTAPEVDSYAERLSLTDKDYITKLEQVRAFLLYAKKEGWLKSNLAAHLKLRKVKGQPQPWGKHGIPQSVTLTQQGYEELKAELETLKSKRVEGINEIRKAAADKDFRENAPLEAAREEHGQLVGRIRELEEAVKSAVVINGKVVINEKRKTAPKVHMGDTVVLQDRDSGEELRYMIVSPREVNPARGKISSVSPVGRAVMGREQGQVIEVVTPAGRLRYHIKLIER